MIPGSTSTALKEWSVTVDALEKGQQILLLRKGGIRETNRHFQVDHGGFFLYPTHYHEWEYLLKPDVRTQLNQVNVDEEADFVLLSVYATVTDIIEVKEKPQVLSLDRFHIWTPKYVENRLNWNPTHPLQLLLLRCYRLVTPISVPVMPEYGGCQSWVELLEQYPLGESRQVLLEHEFQRQVAEIKTTLTETVE